MTIDSGSLLVIIQLALAASVGGYVAISKFVGGSKVSSNRIVELETA